MIYYGFRNSIFQKDFKISKFVQFKRIISIIDLQIAQCLSHTLFEKSTIPHFIWIQWASAANLKGLLTIS